MNPETYRHSGQAPLSGLILAMSATILGSLLLGIFYTFVLSWIPVVQLNVLAPLGLGAAIGGIAGLCARKGKIRNGAIIPFFSVIGAIASLWIAWVFDAKARFGVEDGPLLLNPLWLISYMKDFYEQGFWSIGKNNQLVNGVPLLVVWFFEAVFVLAVSFFVARTIIGSLPFCEDCDQWTNKSEAFIRVVLPIDGARIVQQIKDGDLTVFQELETCVGDRDKTLKLDVCRCPNCEESSYVTVNQVGVTVNKKGEASVALVPVVTQGKISPEEMHHLQAIHDTDHKTDLTTLVVPSEDS